MMNITPRILLPSLLTEEDRRIGAHFDRFGLLTTHIDGNGQTVYSDDLTDTVAAPK